MNQVSGFGAEVGEAGNRIVENISDGFNRVRNQDRGREEREDGVAAEAEGKEISEIRETDVDVDANTNQTVSRKRASLDSKPVKDHLSRFQV